MHISARTQSTELTHKSLHATLSRNHYFYGRIILVIDNQARHVDSLRNIRRKVYFSFIFGNGIMIDGYLNRMDIYGKQQSLLIGFS